jgi:ABC-type multidrug transport system ATPase subunit
VTLPPELLVAGLVDHARAHRPRDAATLDALLRDLRLGPLLERSPGVLSRGERKRITLGLALAADRPVVVLDEPFGAFDPLQLSEVLQVVRSITRAGAAIVVSLHQLHDAERVADRVLLLSEGRRLAFGTIDEVRAQAGSAGSLEDAFVTLLSSPGGHRAA